MTGMECIRFKAVLATLLPKPSFSTTNEQAREETKLEVVFSLLFVITLFA